VQQASEVLKEYRLSVLAVGTENGAPIPVPGGGFLKDASGNIVVAKLESSPLSQLAANGRGRFQSLTANDDDITALSALFNRVEVSTNQAQQDLRLQQWQDRGPWLVLLILPWAALRFRKGLLSLAVLAVLPWPHEAQALDWQSLWQTPDQRAQQAFDQQQYSEAAGQFEDSSWRAAAQYRAGQYQQAAETLKDIATADGHYNRGNALAKMGQLQDALQAYQQALKIDPNHADAQHNAELIKQQLQQQQQQQSSSDDASSNSDDQQDSKDQGGNKTQDAEESSPKSASDSSGKSEENQTPPPPQQDKTAESKDEAREPDAEQAKDEAKSATEQKKKPDSETERANQQLLKRIPDEPTGLLKRKFKYQYGQRRQSQASGQDW
jgi:Ca-activated chloride channel family protein